MTFQGDISLDKIPLYIHDTLTVKNLVQLFSKYAALDQSWEKLRLIVDSAQSITEPMWYEIRPNVTGTVKSGWNIYPRHGERPDSVMTAIIPNSPQVIDIDQSVNEALTMTKSVIARLNEVINDS